MLAGYLNAMIVYVTQSNGLGVDSQVLDLADLSILEATLCPGLLAAEMLKLAAAMYEDKVDIENGIVSNGTVWLEGTSRLTHKHVIIPIH